MKTLKSKIIKQESDVFITPVYLGENDNENPLK